MSGVIVLNPTSGRGGGERRKPELVAELNRLGVVAEIWETERSGHGLELARRALEQGAEWVGAAGGDGTINEVANALAGQDIPMAPIPLGTGNDLCRTLGFGTDWKRAVAAIAAHNWSAIDVGACDAEGASRYFVNIAGCGFDADVARRINTGSRRLKGTLAYIAGILGSFASYRPQIMSLEIDGARHELRAMLCAVANAKSYGGAMLVAPQAEVDDGWLDVVVVAETTKFEFLTTFPKVFKGRHLDHPKVQVFRAQSIRIEEERPTPLLIDGELFAATPATFSLLPGALRVSKSLDSGAR